MDEAIRLLSSHHLTSAAFVGALLESEEYEPYAHELFVNHSGVVMDGLRTYLGQSALSGWARHLTQTMYAEEILALSDKKAGLHFRASKASSAQLGQFSLHDVASTMQKCAPMLWELFDVLLSEDSSLL